MLAAMNLALWLVAIYVGAWLVCSLVMFRRMAAPDAPPAVRGWAALVLGALWPGYVLAAAIHVLGFCPGESVRGGPR
jgi:NADH:ubiquinone oxidoreductase subunit 6 (subunit J)